MNIFASVVILILAMLIQSLTQLTPGTFSLFYHYALGKTTHKKADDLSLSFIFGTELFIATIWILTYAIVNSLSFAIPSLDDNVTLWIITGIIFAEAIIFALFYFRKGKSTALFIPRSVAKNFHSYARSASSRQDCLALGFFVNIPELIFTLPLYIISAFILVWSNTLPTMPIVIIYILISILPLFAIRTFFRTGLNLANIQRFRVHLKPYLSVVLPSLYILLALAIINLGLTL